MNILTLPLISTSIEVYVYVIHEKATNYTDLSQVLANLSNAMIFKLSIETSVKTTKLLMERSQKMFTRHTDDNHKTWPSKKLWRKENASSSL